MNNKRTYKTGRYLYTKSNKRFNYINYLKVNGWIHQPLNNYYSNDGWKYNIKRDMFINKGFVIMITRMSKLISITTYLDFNGRYFDKVLVDEINNYFMNEKSFITEDEFKKVFENLNTAYKKFPFYKKLYLKIRGKFFKTLKVFKTTFDLAGDDLFRKFFGGGTATSYILSLSDMNKKLYKK
jgi:hypothetical protein